MKKILALVLALCMVLALAACGSTAATETAATEAPAEEMPAEEAAAEEAPAEEMPAEEAAAEEAPAEEMPAEEAAADVMTHEEYMAADIDSEVVVETYIQSKQTWWEDAATFYCQSEDGAYFIYNMPCTEEEYESLVPGTKIRVTGYKSEWAGEIEIADAMFEVIDGSWTAEAEDVTALLGTDELAAHQNEYVAFTGMVVESISYKNDEPGDDIYLTLSKDGMSYDFCVEAYNWTTTPNSDLYAAVGMLMTGDVVDVTGYLYWYNGANTHITGVAVTGNVNDKSEGVMTYAEYSEAAVEDEVVVEVYVQNTQTWWEGACSVYAQDAEGGYFIYNMACTEEEYAMLVPGTKLKVDGFKSEWSGEVEIVDATFEIEDDMTYIAPALDVTSAEDLSVYINRFVSFKDAEVTEISYKTGEPNDDIYVKMMVNGVEIPFCVEAYCATTTPDSELYAAVGELQVGDVVDVDCYLYWYEGANPHIVAVSAAA